MYESTFWNSRALTFDFLNLDFICLICRWAFYSSALHFFLLRAYVSILVTSCQVSEILFQELIPEKQLPSELYKDMFIKASKHTENNWVHEHLSTCSQGLNALLWVWRALWVLICKYRINIKYYKKETMWQKSKLQMLRHCCSVYFMVYFIFLAISRLT